jgi:hypothetical protein
MFLHSISKGYGRDACKLSFTIDFYKNPNDDPKPWKVWLHFVVAIHEISSIYQLQKAWIFTR